MIRPSIKRDLLIYLMLSILSIGLLHAALAYYLGAQDIQQQENQQLVRFNLLFQAMLTPANPTNIQEIQTILTELGKTEDKIYKENPTLSSRLNQHDFYVNFLYQVWNDKGQILLKSQNSPTMPLSNGKPGLTDAYLDGSMWHVFTRINSINHLTVITAMRSDRAAILKRSFALRELFILAFSFPLLIFLIWLILSKGFKKIFRIANEIANRDPNYLQPVKIKSLPIEIQPLVDELNKLLALLSQTLDREKRFAADAAHELKTPLAALRTHAQLAQKASDEERRKIALQNLIAGVDRSTHVIQQLLTLSRSSPASAIEKYVNLEFVSLAKQVIMDLAPSAVLNNVELEFNPHQPQYHIQGSIASLTILVRNIVDNAIRYSEPKGIVNIEIFKTANTLVFRVTDNGPGIPEPLRERVFERFFRVLGSNKPGSGLGLAIVKQITIAHGAGIQLSTPPSGKGLRVEITFPL